jgi:hypothetical protein
VSGFSRNHIVDEPRWSGRSKTTPGRLIGVPRTAKNFKNGMKKRFRHANAANVRPKSDRTMNCVVEGVRRVFSALKMPKRVAERRNGRQKSG